MGSMRKSRLSSYRQDHLFEHFVAGTTARTAASLCGVNRKTAAFYFHRLREIIASELEAKNEAMFAGEIEVDESYFGGRRKGKRGRCAAGKIPVFGLLKRGGKVYTKIIPDAFSATLFPIMAGKIVPKSLTRNDIHVFMLLPIVGRAVECWRSGAMPPRFRWFPRNLWRDGGYDRAKRRCAQPPSGGATIRTPWRRRSA